jgi:hypothetical protein
MIDFTAAEAAFVAALIEEVGVLTTDNCKVGDFDAVKAHALKNADVYCFAWTDYGGGSGVGRAIWQHVVNLNVGILFRGDGVQMDDDIRAIVDALYTMLLPESRLSGAVSSCYVLGAQRPEIWNNVENNIPYVTCGFRVALEQEIARRH